MKNIKIILTVLFSVSLLSCDDFLKVNSPSKDDLDYIFTTIEDAQSFVDGVYQPFMEDGYLTAMSMYANPNNDVEMASVSESTDGGRRDAASCETQPSNSSVRLAWSNAWVAIHRANEAIYGIRKSELYAQKNEAMMQLLGEVITLRAFWYFELVKHFGDVPFITEPNRGKDLYLPRTDRDEILSTIINDMMEIEPDMKWGNETKYGAEQVSREFTQALIARIALFRGGYSLRKGLEMKRSEDYIDYYKIANTYSYKVIESKTHQLLEGYKKVFTNQSNLIVKNGDDMIFEVACVPGRSEVGYVIGKRVDAGSHAYGGGGGYYFYTPAYIYSFDTLDVRLFSKSKTEASVASFTKIGSDLNEVILNYDGMQVNKWCRYWLPSPMGSESSKGTSINWPIMRYADVLLMYAETENEINGRPTDEAKDALREVRRRAFESKDWAQKVDAYIADVSVSKEDFFEAIVNERAWELGGELIRPIDLIRWNLFKSKILTTIDQMKQIGMDVNSNSGKYANFPDKIYWKLDPTTGQIDVKGLFTKLDAAPAGYTVKNWLNTLYNAKTDTYPAFLERYWRGITKDTSKPANYLLPIPVTEISKSNGKLSNVGYGWND